MKKNNPFRALKHRILAVGLFSMTLISCTTSLPTSTPPSGENLNIQSLRSHSIASYILETEDSFTIQAVKEAHRQSVDQSVAEFQQNLESGQLEDYFSNPSFSVLLSAGSEGSAFNTAEGIEQIEQNGAVFAQAVVFNEGQPQAQIYKGQFSQGRFFFNNPNRDAEISPVNTTYLIALDPDLETRVFQGQLSAGSEGSALSAGSEGSALSAGSEGSAVLQKQLEQAILEKNQDLYSKALEIYTKSYDSYQQNLSDVTFTIEGLAPWAYTETHARLTRAYPDELRLEFASLRGLPKNVVDEAALDIMERYSQRWLKECGYPVPDGGKLYPQYGREYNTVVPKGYQSEALTQILEAEPAIYDYLKQELQKSGAARYDGRSIEEVLAGFEKEYPETFAQFGWRDEFLPPDCVQPIKSIKPLARPPRINDRATGEGGGPPPAGGGNAGERKPPPPANP